MALTHQYPMANHILQALPQEDYAKLAPHLKLISMPAGSVVHECGQDVDYLYFPTTATVSRLYGMENGATSEIAVTGNEGLVGICLFLGVENTRYRAVVQSGGSGYRLKACFAKAELARGGALQSFALRYTHALITQMSQTAMCNRHHALDQQLCRWLLRNLDLASGNELRVTQEMIARLLGVRREGVTGAALKLQADGLIHYSRGHITILNRKSLELRACECYGVVQKEYERLLPYRLPQLPTSQRRGLAGLPSRVKASTWRPTVAAVPA
jgi:CRP-like cAMP-binding protein